MDKTRPRVGLLVTCLVDLMRPSVGFAAVRLLEAAGCEVVVPRAQTCCGQPAHNAGDARAARAIAAQVIRTFEGVDHVVVPSASCAGMLKRHYPALFAADPEMAGRAAALAARTYELVSYLVDVRGLTAVTARHDGSVAYHDSCAALREMGVRAQPRRLLASVRGLELRELPDSEVCCGFGGAFCVKYPQISGRMVADKAAAVAATDADGLLGGDLGCLLNIAGRLAREGRRVRVRHVAEVLADRGRGPAIGEPAAG